MLQNLLERISKGGSCSLQSLTREFGVSPELMEAMLSDLTRSGYLRRVEGCVESECGGCRPATTCKPQGKVWMLTSDRNLRPKGAELPR